MVTVIVEYRNVWYPVYSIQDLFYLWLACNEYRITFCKISLATDIVKPERDRTGRPDVLFIFM